MRVFMTIGLLAFALPLGGCGGGGNEPEEPPMKVEDTAFGDLVGTQIVSAGSPAEIRFLLDECGFDAAFNYKAGSNLKHLEETAPEGIDVYFDNVGGEALEAALSTLKVRGRIAACGAISLYNSEKPQPGLSNLFLVVVKRLTVRGFIVSDWLDKLGDFQREAGGMFVAGKLKHKETVVEGIENAADAFLGLFKGTNIGKMVVKLGK